MIWMGISKTIGDYYGAHVLLGLGAAPFEALVAISVADVWFVHERGSKLGVVYTSLDSLLAVSSVLFALDS